MHMRVPRERGRGYCRMPAPDRLCCPAMRRYLPGILFPLCGVFIASAARAEASPPIGANDLALIYNELVPASRELAEYYAE
ncbi:MAG: hypothetical protein JXA69_04400, partial [Phycisphaerae bacterium]|nr:hypothetical protein [Phycisphaerae bacterium]